MALKLRNIVTNGTFDDSSSWTVSGASISGGQCAISASGSAYQSISITSGRTYEVSVQIVNDNQITGDLGGTSLVFAGSGARTVTEDVVCGSSDTNITFGSAGTPGVTIIDNVSVKPYSVADTIDVALYDILYSDSTIEGIVSSAIYHQIVPQNTSYPAIRWNQVAGVRNHTLASTDDMVSARFQIDCYGLTSVQARSLADAIRGILDNYTGTVGTVVIQCSHLIDEQDYFSETIGADQLRRYGKTQDYLIWYNE